jgi:CubicO group peptidase (beta-lactamase class C family)
VQCKVVLSELQSLSCSPLAVERPQMRAIFQPDLGCVSATPASEHSATTMNDGQGRPDLQARKPERDALAPYIQALVSRTQAKSGIPGISLLVQHRGDAYGASAGIGCAEAKRPLTLESRFQIGCITKLLTAMVIHRLVDCGKLTLESPITDYLPELSARTPGPPIQVSHLLTHTSGYAGIDMNDPLTHYDMSWERLRSFLLKTPQLFTPGSVFSYEHSEYLLLGEIIRRVCGTDIDREVRERVLRPLGIYDNQWEGNPDLEASEHSYSREHGNYVRITPLPRSRYWAAALSNLTLSLPELLRLVSTSLPDFLFQQSVTLPPPMRSESRTESLPATFGNGLSWYSRGYYGRNGSTRGHSCAFRLCRKDQLTVAVGLNAWRPDVRDWLLEQVFNHLRAGREIAPLAFPPVGQPTDFVGNYAGPQGADLQITGGDDSFACRISWGRGRVDCIEFHLDTNGQMCSRAHLPHQVIGIFRDRHSGSTCLMLGMTAFKRLPA